jgi:predicted aspartyl protease
MQIICGPNIEENLVPMEGYKMLNISVNASVTVTWEKHRQCSKYGM